MAFVIVAARWGITPHDVLPVNLSLYRNMLTYGKAQDIIWTGQSKSVTTIKDELSSRR